ncbi:AraC family transcriptional regulator [Neorhodopirellula pilleata]|uniref:Melibiose operon regulatory protein n=1 Tax=Neorhodopirellula pilleata TaxID=2714738 RepID=A0A5C5ZWD8_9BACT|nr:helix-turn-helix domain-containing protein [Neorhodopirellula pilleata]TWT91904.1 Melibiose operon regulatory protein [Neorhodopirellula pilleata]
MNSRFQEVRLALQEELPPWGVLVFESHHASEFQMPWRTHAFAKIVYVLEGAGSFDIEKNVIDFSSGDVILIPPGVRNRIRDCEGQPVSLYAACVAEYVIDCVPGLGKRMRPTNWSDEPRRTLAIASVLRRMVWTQDHRQAARSFEMLADAWRLFGLIAEEPSNDSSPRSLRDSSREILPDREINSDGEIHSDREIVEQYVEELNTSFLDARSIDQAAETCGLSRRAFTHWFREVTGTSWLAHVRQLAIDHASVLLRDSDLPIVSVAFEAGFADLSTFYRQFSKRVGLSPAAYRDQSRKPNC